MVNYIKLIQTNLIEITSTILTLKEKYKNKYPQKTFLKNRTAIWIEDVALKKVIEELILVHKIIKLSYLKYKYKKIGNK